jgi:hypothetical protein
MLCIYVQYYSAIKKHKILALNAIWMILIDIKISEKKKSQPDRKNIISYPREI